MSKLLQALQLKPWISDIRFTPPDYRGPERAINYLSNYVVGTAISDGRLISHETERVSFRIKDYRAGGTAIESLSGAEFARRFVMHIVPRSMSRLRHAGLFAGKDRESRLITCRKLIAEVNALSLTDAPTPFEDSERATQTAPAPAEASDEQRDPPERQHKPCYCRHCQHDLELLGRLKGTESLWGISLARAIVLYLATMLPVINEETFKELLFQLQTAWLVPKRMPLPIRLLFGVQRPTSLQCAAIEARLMHELRDTPLAALLGNEINSPTPTLTSGIPPPAADPSSLPQELSHVA